MLYVYVHKNGMEGEGEGKVRDGKKGGRRGKGESDGGRERDRECLKTS